MLSVALGELDTALQRPLHILWQIAQLMNVASPSTLRLIVALILRKPEGNEDEHHNLGNVSLCTRNRQLSATVQENAAIVFSGQRRIDLIHNIDALETHSMCKAERNE